MGITCCNFQINFSVVRICNMEEFVVRAERIRNGGVDPSEDNFLKIIQEARLFGTDARLSRDVEINQMMN